MKVLKIRLPKFLREDLSSLELRTEGQVMEPRLRQGFLNLAIEAKRDGFEDFWWNFKALQGLLEVFPMGFFISA